ncbi:MAG: helix-turn-helix domain-containing protein [Catenulispora sp.]|nr:helix-turn-helix domain-containing protein [Catenulispora sp.]
MPDTSPMSLAERLDGLPDVVGVRQIAEALGVTAVTVRNWAAAAGWTVAEKRGTGVFYRRREVEAWLRENEASRLDTGSLGDDPDEMLTMRQICDRTGYPRSTISSYPSLYGPSSKDPFPPADAVGRRRAGDVQAWFSRRRTRSGPRGTAVETGRARRAKRAPVARDVVDIHGIAEATGKSLDEVKVLMRRQPLAAMQLPEKVGRSRVWPRKELLAALRRLDRPAPPPAKTPARRKVGPEERRWLRGSPKSATELAEHYGVTISAVMKRIERAVSSGDPERQPPEPVEAGVRTKRYNPADFDRFWWGGKA